MSLRSGRAGARVAFASALGALSFVAPPARALETTGPDGAPLRIDVTDTAIVNWHFDNRNGVTDDDHYGEWINRLDTRASWQRWSAGLRIDSATFYAAPTPNYLASQDLASQPPNTGSAYSYYQSRYGQYQTSLAERYRTTVYPSKLFVTWATPDIELTAGDFYVQLGRGLVLSLRKIDEVAIDTTMRGAKAEWRGHKGDFRWTATAVGGVANPVRIDEASGRRLTADPALYSAGMPTPDRSSSSTLEQTANFRPDGIVGAQLEAGTKDLVAGVRGSVIARGGPGTFGTSPDPASVTWQSANLGRANTFIDTASVSLSAPNLPYAGALYVEAAAQRLTNAQLPAAAGGTSPGRADIGGHALYASFGMGGEPVNVLVELRHTRSFWPLLANVDTRAPEFLQVAYSAPPTTEPITTDTELGSFGVCTTGGRARVDVRASDMLSLYGSLGAYETWTERSDSCGAGGQGLSPADRNDVLDPFVGARVNYDEHKSHGNVWGGVRVDDTAQPFVAQSGETTSTFYREGYVRYDWFHVLTPVWALQNQGFHRARTAKQTDATSWNEGENYLAVQWNAKVIGAFGYEYTDRGGGWLNYFNGSVLWRFAPGASVRAFVGQQRGALRCVSGVCRVFPPFEGAKMELVVRF